mmetsp:Transcript_6301/g.6221  ORF Transcript_6301/g.6221 Transcript_6301/m.6221 type:complete len:120 (-) Transcript_6301:1241-1600(-)
MVDQKTPVRPTDNLSTEKKQAFVMKEYTSLQEIGDDGMTWANKTAQWIAYERMLESERPYALFNDQLAKYFVGDHGKRCSDAFSCMAINMFADVGSEGFTQYHAARTKLISDTLPNGLH